MKRGLGQWLAMLSMAVSCFAQGRVDEFLNVKNWKGMITIKGSASGSSSGGGISDVWQCGVTDSFNIALNAYNPNSQTWTGTFTGTAAVSGTDKSTIGNCVENFGLMYNGPVGVGKTFSLSMEGSNTYYFYPQDYVVSGATGTTSTTCGGSTSSTGQMAWSPFLGDKRALPATGFALTGSVPIKMDCGVQPQSAIFTGLSGAAVINATLTWDLQGDANPNEVVVQKTPELMNWRPTAGAKGARGNSVNLIAKLQQKGGAPSNVKAAQFIWELTKSSKEPGYAMNAELDSPNSNFDLKLESGPDGLLIFDTNAQKAQSKAGEQTQSTVTVASYDWGGFGTIKVTAMLPDGSPLVGYLQGDEQQTDIRLPLRSADSNIADIWKQQHGVSGFPDSADFEADPVGDSNAPGDGLTLYEEYRGFIMNGNHIEGDPKKKDYFIVNTAGALYQSGINLFQSLSGLAVHYKLRKTEVPLNRVINKNHGEGAHKGDQHAVVISTIAANAGYCEATGGPGPPRMISQVVAPKIMPSAAYSWTAYLNPSLTHELFHACNVYHHGEGERYLTLQRLPDDTVLAGGAPANVITEDGASAAPLFPVNIPFKIVLGVNGDTHSGNDNCVMRYDNSLGYFSATDGHTVYYVGKEDSGDNLCASGAGTGINGPRTPQPRYGDAVRGNCQSQIVVNDNGPAPSR